MGQYEDLVRKEVTATIDRAGIDCLDEAALDCEVTPTFRRKLGECRRTTAGTIDDGDQLDRPTDRTLTRYRIRIAERLFDAEEDDIWRDTVRHEVAHAVVMERSGTAVQPHGPEWRIAARRAGAEPTARYDEGDAGIEADYVLSCPNACFEREYLKRSKRIRHPGRYRCGSCDAKLISYDAEDRPSRPRPGTCYVSSLG